MSEKQTEPTLTESELQKSIESLMKLLDSEAPASEQVADVVEKSLVATEGGLADEAGAPSLNPELTMGGVEAADLDEDAEDAAAGHESVQAVTNEMVAKSAADEDKDMNKSEVVDEAVETQAESDEFAKSLAAAFVEQDGVVDAASSSDFAKSLVLGTIEGLSIAHEEFAKSLSELEARNDEKIMVLAKGIAAIARAVDEIRNEVVKVSNAPVRPMAKSVQAGVQVLEKSFGGSAPVDPALFKSKVMAALEARVQAGKVNAFDLVKYETTGVLDPALAKEIQSELGL